MNPAESHNRVDLARSFPEFKDERLTFSVSSRRIRPDIDLVDYLNIFYIYCDLRQIESVFGSTTRDSRLYGGRVDLASYRLTPMHLARLRELGIGLSLTLTNHFFDEGAYRDSRPLLEEHHQRGNSIICTNDQLAARLRHDFPLYEIKASIIKEIDTIEKARRALEIYDSLTVPMNLNDDDVFLDRLPEKHRVILFGNANCAYTCPARTCYLGFSQENAGQPVTSACSKAEIPRLDLGHVFFDVRKLAGMGFTRFKLVPLAPPGAAGACRGISRRKNYPLAAIEPYKTVSYLCSYRKCGRTWLRFILANYLNLAFRLGLDINLHTYFALLPNNDHDPLKGIDTYRCPTDPRLPLVLSSHAAYTAGKFPATALPRLVFLLRSIPDVVVSDFFQATRVLKSFSGDLKSFLRDPRGGLARYCQYLNSWAPVVLAGRPLVLTYERLHRETEKTVAGLLDFLGLPLQVEPLREALRLSSFETMQALEKEMGMPGHPASPEDPEAFRLRKGEVGGSRAYLDGEDLEYLQQTCASLLTGEAKGLLRKYIPWDDPDSWESGSRDRPPK